MKLFDVTQTKINSSNWNFTKGERSQLYISNHRDIVLDAAILNILMLLNKRETVEIAIGDNLLFIPWVADIVRLNKSFIVKRNLPIKQLLEKEIVLRYYYRIGRIKADIKTDPEVLKAIELINDPVTYKNILSGKTN